jgi:hypothetical protein
MLTYAGICFPAIRMQWDGTTGARTLTYAGVCGRLLTYAGTTGDASVSGCGDERVGGEEGAGEADTHAEMLAKTKNKTKSDGETGGDFFSESKRTIVTQQVGGATRTAAAVGSIGAPAPVLGGGGLYKQRLPPSALHAQLFSPPHSALV